jgi:FlaG/FlaF family flagellin (archaellin)
VLRALTQQLRPRRAIMLRRLRSITRDTQSVTEIVGLILMITIALVAATTVQVYIGGGGGEKSISPMVSMIQNGNYLSITDIQYGPIEIDSIKFDVHDEDGTFICNGDLTSNGDELSAGDTITFNFALNSGETYFVFALYSGNQVGRQKYIAP